MKFVIEMEDFWLEGEELNASLKSEIKRDVVAKISESIKGKVETEITRSINAAMEEKIKLVIDSAIGDFIATGTITVDRQQVAVKTHLRNTFENHHGWNNPTSKMQEIAKRFGEELKIQYNNIFATKIVTTMQQQGFLRDDMARILLGDKTST